MDDEDKVRETLTERKVYQRPGAYSFKCTGPMQVVGNWSNFCPDPGFVAKDFINHRTTKVTVFYRPEDTVSVEYAESK